MHTTDYRLGVAMLQGKAVDAIELSALRQPELAPLCEGVDALDLTQFAYVAVHAPSSVRRDDEPQVVEALAGLAERGWNIVHHPDAIHDFSLWARLGERLLIENMDKRKPIGRTAAELADAFQRLPHASFCFDIGHARQVDPTMTVAYFLLKEFGSKLKQLPNRNWQRPETDPPDSSGRGVSREMPETLCRLGRNLDSRANPFKRAAFVQRDAERIPAGGGSPIRSPNCWSATP